MYTIIKLYSSLNLNITFSLLLTRENELWNDKYNDQ